LSILTDPLALVCRLGANELSMIIGLLDDLDVIWPKGLNIYYTF